MKRPRSADVATRSNSGWGSRTVNAGAFFLVLTVTASAQPPKISAGPAAKATGASRSPLAPAKGISGAPTFARDVAPILYKNCTVCHRAGSVGPFPLFEYDSAKAYEHEIREKISLSEMPPWHAVGERGVFKNDRRLSDADKNIILRWLDAGALPGDLKKLPARPTYAASWSIGKPDVVFTMPEDFEVAASGTIEYQHFSVETKFTQDMWVEAYEILPGNREVVHHVQVYAKAPPNPPGTPWLLSPISRNPKFEPVAAPPATGLRAFFSSFLKNDEENKDYGTMLGSMAPGTNPIELPKGTALRIKAGTVLTFGMHYTSKGHKMKDRTSIGFRFAKEPPEEEMISSALTNAVFSIPAGAKVQVPSEFTLREPIKIWGLLPHTHLRGTRWEYKMTRADGSTEIILDIPKYDFNWQTFYLWDKPLDVPKGARISAIAWYDNSAANRSNPDPTKIVQKGLQTWEEMQYTGFLYTIPSRKMKKTAPGIGAKPAAGRY